MLLSHGDYTLKCYCHGGSQLSLSSIIKLSSYKTLVLKVFYKHNLTSVSNSFREKSVFISSVRKLRYKTPKTLLQTGSMVGAKSGAQLSARDITPQTWGTGSSKHKAETSVTFGCWDPLSWLKYKYMLGPYMLFLKKPYGCSSGLPYHPLNSLQG